MTGGSRHSELGRQMRHEKQAFEFVVEHTGRGWMVLGGLQSLGPFLAKEHAIDLANGMAAGMRAMGDAVLVRVKD
jgi:hypothetical protein